MRVSSLQGEMARMRDVLVTCMVILHVTWAYVDLPAELPPHMGPPPSGISVSLLCTFIFTFHHENMPI